MQIKIAIRYHYTPLEWLQCKSIIIRSTEDVQKQNPQTLLVCKMVQLLWRTAWQFLKNLNIYLLCDPAISLGSYPREMKIHVHITTLNANVLMSVIHSGPKPEINTDLHQYIMQFIHTRVQLISKKEQLLIKTTNNMVDPKKHYVK